MHPQDGMLRSGCMQTPQQQLIQSTSSSSSTADTKYINAAHSFHLVVMTCTLSNTHTYMYSSKQNT
jgi:hypothetical protein